MKEHDMPKADLATSLVLIAFGAAVIILSLGMPTFAEMGRNPYSAPGLVPGLLGGILSFLGIILLIRSIVRGGHHLGLNRESVSTFFRKGSTIRVLVTLLLSFLYAIIMIGRVNYLASTIIYVFAFIVYFEYERRKTRKEHVRSLAFGMLEALIVTLSVAGVFRYLFLVSLP